MFRKIINFRQVYGPNSGQKCHLLGQFGQNRSFFGVFLYFLVKMPIPRRYFRNDVPFFGSPNDFAEIYHYF